MASTKDITSHVTANMRKHLAKQKWKVSSRVPTSGRICSLALCHSHICSLPPLKSFQQAFHATSVIRHMRQLKLNSSNNASTNESATTPTN